MFHGLIYENDCRMMEEGRVCLRSSFCNKAEKRMMRQVFDCPPADNINMGLGKTNIPTSEVMCRVATLNTRLPLARGYLSSPEGVF